jgi:hypothetical protein
MRDFDERFLSATDTLALGFWRGVFTFWMCGPLLIGMFLLIFRPDGWEAMTQAALITQAVCWVIWVVARRLAR